MEPSNDLTMNQQRTNSEHNTMQGTLVVSNSIRRALQAVGATSNPHIHDGATDMEYFETRLDEHWLPLLKHSILQAPPANNVDSDPLPRTVGSDAKSNDAFLDMEQLAMVMKYVARAASEKLPKMHEDFVELERKRCNLFKRKLKDVTWWEQKPILSQLIQCILKDTKMKLTSTLYQAAFAAELRPIQYSEALESETLKSRHFRETIIYEVLSETGFSGVQQVKRCAVCSKKTTLYCRSCGLVYYCGRNHQEKDWNKKHRDECPRTRMPS